MTAPLPVADIQGNLLRGYRSPHARHFALAVGQPAGARRFVGDLASGDERRGPQITTAEHWGPNKPHYRLNIGVTWAGLKALEVPAGVLANFPTAFQQGPAVRALAPDPDFPQGVGLGDTGESSPEHWVLGGLRTPTVHLLVSLYTDSNHLLEELSGQLRGAFAAAGLTEVCAHDANALSGGTVHFGYRDGIAQPHIDRYTDHDRRDRQPRAPTGDFLLGGDYVNSYGGNHLGKLLPQLGNNGTYAAFRVLRQHVDKFEALLTEWQQQSGLDRELLAAKLLGRWRRGVPLTLSPQAPDTDPPVSKAKLNEFDYAPGQGHSDDYDDLAGVRCPVGSHIRRCNPRGSLVMGLAHTRRIVRRGMPYGPPFDPEQPDDGHERGLLGMFICADLETQYEFIQRVWANSDFSTHGVRGTRDPLIGVQPDGGGQFRLQLDEGREPLTLTGLPRLVQTRGSLYCFIPGIGALRYLAAGGGA